MSVLGPVSFIIASLIVYWSGWSTVSWLLSLQILMFVVYLLAGRFVPTEHLSLKQQVHSSLWLVGFYAMIIVFSKLGSFGGIGVLAHPLDNVVVGLCSWASTTGAHAPVCRHTCCVWMPMKRKNNRTSSQAPKDSPPPTHAESQVDSATPGIFTHAPRQPRAAAVAFRSNRK